MVVYGDKWWEIDPPKICLKPEEYEPGKYDFHMLAGLHVTVVDQLAQSAEVNEFVLPPTFGKFYDLLAEIAAADAWVTVEYPAPIEPRTRNLEDLALDAKWWSRELRAYQWPRWWNDELEAKHARRWSAWHMWRAYDLGILERERGRAA